MNVSVIIATYNRVDIVIELLKRWEDVKKASKYSFELIFSDDGSTDETIEVLKQNRELDIKILENKHSGASGARNTAISECIGEIILFTGDDIFPALDFVDKHYESYLKNGEDYATLGKLIWPDDINLSYLMHHITDVGYEQFSFPNLPAYSVVDFRHFYTSNISISQKKLLELDKFFDMTFDKYGFEDIELGYRLFKNGVKIFYNPDIIGEHYHIYNKVKKFCKRQKSAGETLITFYELHPEIDNYIKIGIEDLKQNKEDFLAHNSLIKLKILNFILKVFLFFLLIFSEITEFVTNKFKFKILKKLCSFLLCRLFRIYFYIGVLDSLFKHDEDFLKLKYIYLYKFFNGGYLQIFYSEKEEFKEKNSKKRYLIGKKFEEFNFEIPNDVKKIRFDPYNGYCKIKIIELNKNKKEKLTFRSNAKEKNEGNLNFLNTIDPIIILENELKKGDNINIHYEISYFYTKQKAYFLLSKIKKILKLRSGNVKKTV